MTRRVGC